MTSGERWDVLRPMLTLALGGLVMLLLVPPIGWAALVLAVCFPVIYWLAGRVGAAYGRRKAR